MGTAQAALLRLCLVSRMATSSYWRDNVNMSRVVGTLGKRVGNVVLCDCVLRIVTLKLRSWVWR